MPSLPSTLSVLPCAAPRVFLALLSPEAGAVSLAGSSTVVSSQGTAVVMPAVCATCG